MQRNRLETQPTNSSSSDHPESLEMAAVYICFATVSWISALGKTAAEENTVQIQLGIAWLFTALAVAWIVKSCIPPITCSTVDELSQAEEGRVDSIRIDLDVSQRPTTAPNFLHVEEEKISFTNRIFHGVFDRFGVYTSRYEDSADPTERTSLLRK